MENPKSQPHSLGKSKLAEMGERGPTQKDRKPTGQTGRESGDTYSVPLRRRIRNCSGERIALHSPSVFCTDPVDAITALFLPTRRKNGDRRRGGRLGWHFEGLGRRNEPGRKYGNEDLIPLSLRVFVLIQNHQSFFILLRASFYH